MMLDRRKPYSLERSIGHTRTAWPSLKINYPPDVSGASVVQPVNELFLKDVPYWNNGLTKKSGRYDDNVANEIDTMTNKSVVQIKNGTFK